MTPVRSESIPGDCEAFTAALQQVLDRERPLESLSSAHTAVCRECQSMLESARLLMAGLDRTVPDTPPRELGERIVATAVRDYRRRRAMRYAGSGLAVAAAALLAVGLFASWRGNRPDGDMARAVPEQPVPEPPATTVPPDRVADRVAEAGSALASITRKASDQTLTPTRTLVPSTDPTTLVSADLPTGLEPAAESLAGMPDAAKSGIEPVTTGVRRAMNLFLRDTGLGSTKPKS